MLIIVAAGRSIRTVRMSKIVTALECHRKMTSLISFSEQKTQSHLRVNFQHMIDCLISSIPFDDRQRDCQRLRTENGLEMLHICSMPPKLLAT